MWELSALYSATVPSPPAGSPEERASIIDAAYACLSRPHAGAVPVAAILRTAGVSSRAFYRHFASKDELFLAMLRQTSDDLTRRLDNIADANPGCPAAQLKAWVDHLFVVAFDPGLHAQLSVLDSDEVRAVKGYRRLREHVRSGRERSLVEILERGRADGTFPYAVPADDALSVNALVSRVLNSLQADDPTHGLREKRRTLDFMFRALGAPAA